MSDMTRMTKTNGRNPLEPTVVTDADAPAVNGNGAAADFVVSPLANGFREEFYWMSEFIHGRVVEKGFWDERTGIPLKMVQAGIFTPEEIAYVQKAFDAQMLMLAVGELSEAMEALRSGNPPDEKVPEFSSVETEIADAIIRLMDTGIGRGLRIGEAIVAKQAYNLSRPHKHGRAF